MMPPRSRRRVSPGASTSNPINLSGFTPLISLIDHLGNSLHRSFPTGMLVDSHYRSRRALLWWRRAIDAIRMMIRNLDPTKWFWTNRGGYWKRTAPRPPGLLIDYDEIPHMGFDPWKANTRTDQHIYYREDDDRIWPTEWFSSLR